MSILELLDALRRTSRNWRLECVGLAFPGVIRVPDPAEKLVSGKCPVIVLCQLRFGPDHPLSVRDGNLTRVIAAGRELSLADDDTRALVAAADAYAEHDPSLRNALLLATGLALC